MDKAVRVVAGGLVAVALALTGCAQPPSAAAIVDGVAIPDRVVREAAVAFADSYGAEIGGALQQVTFDLAVGQASQRIAAERSIQITDADVAELLATEPRAQAAAQTAGGAPWAQAVATTYLTLDRLGQDAFMEDLSGIDITINPRYGSWDPARATLVDGGLAARSGATQG